jgi:hypothetical protein
MKTAKLAPKPGHVVAIPAPGYRCDFCGAPATWDIPTSGGARWANACDACEPRWHSYPGQTGVGVGQRLILREETEDA